MNKKTVQVAVGVVIRHDGRILLTRRAENSHQGGLWEFPGGKIENGETVTQALNRELQEEVGIAVSNANPLIQIPFQYPDKTVCLHVYKVDRFSGTARAQENQPLRWVELAALKTGEFPLPAANRPILAALQLPSCMAITGAYGSTAEFLQKLQTLADHHAVGVIQIRLLEAGSLKTLLPVAAEVLLNTSKPVIVNVGCENLTTIDSLPNFQGIHLSAMQLMACRKRPLNSDQWLGASCHNLLELRQAEKIGADYVTLSPVNTTTSHPQASAMGWEKFAEWVSQTSVPVYGLGGLGEKDLLRAQNHGAQGIAAITEFWC